MMLLSKAGQKSSENLVFAPHMRFKEIGRAELLSGIKPHHVGKFLENVG